MDMHEYRIITVFLEYSIEKFSEVLNVHHRYSIFLLISVFPQLKYTNKQTVFAVDYSLLIAAFEYKFQIYLGVPTKTC